MTLVVLTQLGNDVRVVGRDDWAIVQQMKDGEWRDMRLFDRRSNDMAWENARDDAERLVSRMTHYSQTQRNFANAQEGK